MAEKSFKGGVGAQIPHDSASLHVSGEALYIDDLPEPEKLLHGSIVMSPVAHAKLLSVDSSQALKMAGIVDCITAAEIPGHNEIGPIFEGEPLLADKILEYVGQPVAVVAANSHDQSRRAADLVRLEYSELPPVLSIEEALEKESFVSKPHTLLKGDPDGALEKSPRKLTGEFKIGGQDHFYLEGQIAMAVPTEGDMLVYSSTQNPTEVQCLVAECLGVPFHCVTVETRRMGGGFGGKETQPAIMACCAAILASRSGRPVKIRLIRDDDMIMTGKRHPFLARYEVGFDEQGRIQALDMTLACNAGNSADLSSSILDRALFHSDNTYYLDHCRIRGFACKTNTVSNTAFRGFGGPQGMLAIENIMDEISRELGLESLEVRRINLYGKEERNITPYHQKVEDNIAAEVIEQLVQSSDYHKRRKAIEEFNRSQPIIKKGLALSPVKFGISFTTSFLNQAGALVHIYKDGSIALNHGGTEMGQGLFTKVAQVVAEEFQVDLERIRITATHTGKVPNASATAASSGSDLNGKAAQAAAQTIKARLVSFLSKHFKLPEGEIEFLPNQIKAGSETLSFDEVVNLAYHQRISLSSTGYYSTPKIHYDRDRASGRPFFYYAYGACVSEVSLDTLTGEYKVTRSDILHDVGDSLNPAIDLGQIEGAFIQGLGWLTMEELWWDETGSLKTHAPSTYKIPTCRDIPQDFRVQIKPDSSNREETIYRSKAVGEPPFMLGISVWLALKDALAYAVGVSGRIALDSPATPEALLLALEDQRKSS